MWLAGVVATGSALWLGRPPYTRERILAQSLRYLYLFPLGLMGIWIFLSYTLFPAQSADAIAWAPSPFQYEVAVANLGLGVAAIYAAFSTRQAKFAVALALAVYLICSGLGHISDLMNGDPYKPGNAGPILYSDFLAPIVAFVLLWLTRRDEPVATAEIAEEVAPERPAAPARRQLPPPAPKPAPALPAPAPQELTLRPRRQPPLQPSLPSSKRPMRPAPPPVSPAPPPFVPAPSQPQTFEPQTFEPAPSFSPEPFFAPEPSPQRPYRPEPSPPPSFSPEPSPLPSFDPVPAQAPLDSEFGLDDDELQRELERELERARQAMRDSLTRGDKGPPRR